MYRWNVNPLLRVGHEHLCTLNISVGSLQVILFDPFCNGDFLFLYVCLEGAGALPVPSVDASAPGAVFFCQPSCSTPVGKHLLQGCTSLALATLHSSVPVTGSPGVCACVGARGGMKQQALAGCPQDST